MNKANLLLCMLFVLMIGCTGQTNEEKIIATTDKVLAALKSGDQNDFEKLIGVELIQIGKNNELISSDFKRCSTLYSKYLTGKKSKVLITNEYTHLGQRKIIIPIYNGYDSLNGISEVQLDLYFGPPNFVPLSKISNYKLIIDYHKPPSMVLPLPRN